MTSTRVITAKDVENTKAWIKKFFAVDETLVAKDWITGFFYPDAAITFNNEPPQKGHEQLIPYFDHFNSMFTKIDHLVGEVDVLPDRFYMHLKVDLYIKKDPQQVPVSVCSLICCDKKVDEDKCSLYNIYFNGGVLHQRLAEYP